MSDRGPKHPMQHQSNGCSGDDFTIGRAEVQRIDKNGVKLFASHNGRNRYHFSINGMSSDEVSDLFSQWITASTEETFDRLARRIGSK